MGTISLATWLSVLFGGFIFSALLVMAALRYSTTRALLDHPGVRRSHSVPTPRGGGIGVVIAFLACLKVLALFAMVPVTRAWGLAAALILVAGIGYLDDHRSQSVERRLGVHAFASILVMASLLGFPHDGWQWLWAVVGIVVLMTAINFSNFMDGSNGMLTLQAMALGAALMLLAIFAGNAALAVIAALLVATTSGFLPFNFPQAQIFLGDVGSGAIGLLIAALGMQALVDGSVGGWLLLVLSSALWLDAGLTLSMRILTRRSWTTAHRSHLYQWLLRGGLTHSQLAFLYLGWTLLFAMPMVLISMAGWLSELAAFAVVLGCGAMLWVGGRLALRRQLRRRRLPRAASPSTSDRTSE
ncbi:MAG: glycosyl transferase family 4 [Pseudomarimonas sp.]